MILDTTSNYMRLPECRCRLTDNPSKLDKDIHLFASMVPIDILLDRS